MSAELLYALDELEKDKGIDREVIIAAIEEALNASYGKSETEGNTRVEFNRETGDIKVYAQKEVVEKMENDTTELSLEEARKIDPEFEIGDIAEFEITPKNFGRLAAQKAKQIIIQKLREEERTRVYRSISGKRKRRRDRARFRELKCGRTGTAKGANHSRRSRPDRGNSSPSRTGGDGAV